MPTISTIVKAVSPFFNQEFPPSKVFVIMNSEIKSLLWEDIDSIDNTHFLVDMSENRAEYSKFPNMPIIARKQNV